MRVPHASFAAAATWALQFTAGVSAGMRYLFGADFPEMLTWIIVLMVADHVLAVMAVLIDDRQSFSRRKFLVGFAKKVAMLMAFIPAAAIDRGFHFVELLEIGRHPMVAFVILSLVVHEAGSNIKNIMRVAGKLLFLRTMLERISTLSNALDDRGGKEPDG